MFITNRINFIQALSFLLTANMLLLVVGCTNDNGIMDESLESCEIKLSIPENEMMIVRSDPSYDCTLSKAYVLAYSSASNLPVFAEKIEVGYITNNATQTPTLRMHGKIQDNEHVYVVANTEFVASGIVTSLYDIPQESIFDFFPLYHSQLVGINDGSALALPMFGEVSSWTGSDTCSMERAVAKVKLSLESVVTYSDAEMKTYFEAQPAPTWSMNTFNRGGNFIDMDAGTVCTMKTFTPNANNAVYLYQYPNATYANATPVLNNVFNKNRDCVIMKYGDGYFRLDFSVQNTISQINMDAQNTYIDILRNYIYTFKIARIFSYGYSTPQEALQNPAGNVEYTIEAVDIDKPYVSSNGQYAIATDRAQITLFDDEHVLLNFDLCTNVMGQPDITTAYIDIVDADNNAESIEGHFYINGGNTMSSGVLQLDNQTGNRSFTLELTDVLHDEQDYYNSLDGKYLRISMGNIKRKIPIIHVPVTFYYGTANSIEQPTTGVETEYSFDATPYTTTSEIYSYQNTPDNELCQPYSAAMLWSDVSSDFVKDVTVTHNADGTHTVNYKTPGTPGNAIIAIYNKPDPDDTTAVILWTFHVWASNRNDTTQWYSTYNWVDEGKPRYPHQYEMMDRNLGATSTNPATLASTDPPRPADNSSIGFYYQWGRKDPFIGGVDYKTSSYTTPTLYRRPGYPNETTRRCIAATTETESVKYTIKNPLVFLTGSGLLAKDHALWGNPNRSTDSNATHEVDFRKGVKSVYDPCPEGYQVPPKNAFTCSLLGSAPGAFGQYWNRDVTNLPDGGTYVYYDYGTATTLWPSSYLISYTGKKEGGIRYHFFWTNAVYGNNVTAPARPVRASFGTTWNPIWDSSSYTQGYSVRCVKIHW